MQDDIRNQGLTPEVAEAYAVFDVCEKVCTQFKCGFAARTALEVAKAIVDAGIDTKLCLSGFGNVPCPYGYTNTQVMSALTGLVGASDG